MTYLRYFFNDVMKILHKSQCVDDQGEFIKVRVGHIGSRVGMSRCGHVVLCAYLPPGYHMPVCPPVCFFMCLSMYLCVYLPACIRVCITVPACRRHRCHGGYAPPDLVPASVPTCLPLMGRRLRQTTPLFASTTTPSSSRPSLVGCVSPFGRLCFSL